MARFRFPWFELLLFAAFIAIVLWVIRRDSRDFGRQKKKERMEYLIDQAVEHFETHPDIEETIIQIKEEISNNDGGDDKWKTFYARPGLDSGKNYFLLPWNNADNIQNALFKASDKDGKILVERPNGSSNVLVMTGTPTLPGSGEYKCRYFGKTGTIRYKDCKERVDMDMDGLKMHIIGYGDQCHKKSLPHPWFKCAPMVLQDGGRTVAIFTSPVFPTGQVKKGIPVEISVPEDQEKYLPMYFFVYAMLQSQIKKKML